MEELAVSREYISAVCGVAAEQLSGPRLQLLLRPKLILDHLAYLPFAVAAIMFRPTAPLSGGLLWCVARPNHLLSTDTHAAGKSRGASRQCRKRVNEND